MDASSSQTQVCWQMRCVQQVAIYSKVQGKSIVAIVRIHAINIIVDLLVCNCGPARKFSRYCGMWPGTYIASNKHPASVKGLAT